MNGVSFSRTIAVIAKLAVILLMHGCSFGNKKIHFEEDVQLANGEVIKVDRFIVTKPLGEIGGPGGWEPEYMSLEIASPKHPEDPPKWESTEGLLPILFDKDPGSGEWALLATFYTCEPWYALGRPKLPYAEFRVRNGQWQRVELSEQWIGRSANVLTDISSGGEPDHIGLPMKQERMSDPRTASEYRLIVDRWTTGC